MREGVREGVRDGGGDEERKEKQILTGNIFA